MRRIAVLDAPSNLGLRPPTATSVPGCAKAPGALRDHGLLTRLGARDAGCLTPPRYDAGDWRPGDGVAHASQIAAYSRALAGRIGAILDAGEFPVILGGDCSILLGSGLAMHRLGEAVGGRIGLVFVDGHSDFRHPGNASYVGAAAGEDLALVTGRGQADLASIEGRRPYFRDIDVVVLGIRAQDEYRLDLQAAGIVTRPVPALRAEGAARSAQWARDQLVDCAGFWLHVDVDVLDPAVMPAVDAPSPGGIAFPELELLLAGLVESPHCLGVEITVFDPDYDPDGSYAAEITTAVAAGLAAARTVTPRPDLIAARADLATPPAPTTDSPSGGSGADSWAEGPGAAFRAEGPAVGSRAEGSGAVSRVEGSGAVFRAEGSGAVSRVEGPAAVSQVEGSGAVFRAEGSGAVSRAEGPAAVSRAERSAAGLRNVELGADPIPEIPPETEISDLSGKGGFGAGGEALAAADSRTYAELADLREPKAAPAQAAGIALPVEPEHVEPVAEVSAAPAGELPGGEPSTGELPSGKSAAGGPATDELTVGEPATDELAAGGLAADGAPSGEVPSGELSGGELSEGERSSGELSPGEVPSGELSEGERSSGEVSPGEVSEGEPSSDELSSDELADDELPTDGPPTDDPPLDGSPSDELAIGETTNDEPQASLNGEISDLRRGGVEAEPEPVRIVSRPLGQAPLLDSEPLPATRPGMLRPRPRGDVPAADGLTLPAQRPAFDVGSGSPADIA